MTLGRRPFPERHVTFGASEIRIFFLRINFKIQSAAIVGCRRNVAAIRAAARLNGHLYRPKIDSAERRGISLVAIQTIQIRMFAAFVTEPTGGNATTPTRDHCRVSAHARGQRRIKINGCGLWWLQLVTDFAVLRLGCDP